MTTKHGTTLSYKRGENPQNCRGHSGEKRISSQQISRVKAAVRLRKKLEDSRRYQYFHRDADKLESRIHEKLQAASDENYNTQPTFKQRFSSTRICGYIAKLLLFLITKEWT